MRKIGLCSIACLLMMLTLVAEVRAESGLSVDPPLIPLSSPGFVELVSLSLDVELFCDGPLCGMRIRQTCQLHNRDRVEPAVMRVGLPAGSDRTDSDRDDLVLRDGSGQALARARGDSAGSLAWEITLAQNEKKNLSLEYTRPAKAGSFVQWRTPVSLLSGWGTVRGIRVEFRLPTYATEDAFLQLEPADYRMDGTSLVWDSANVDYAADISLVMYAPPIWRRMRMLQSTGAHLDLARLYGNLWTEAEEEDVPFPDPFDRIVAELLAAKYANPDDLVARIYLAQAYRRRAEQVPSLHLNYLVLSAQELAYVAQQRSGDKDVAELLSQTYYEAATTASEDGDPAGALAYLRRAAQVPGIELAEEAARREDLILRWALDLAEQGMVEEAISQLSGMLSSQTEDAILRYSPPFVSVRTIVSLDPAHRDVRYEFVLYQPSTPATYVRLQDIAGRIELGSEAEVALRSAEDIVFLKVDLPYESLEELTRKSEALVLLLAEDPDLTSMAISAPWEAEPVIFQVDRGLWRDRYRYREVVDLGQVQAQWEEESQYIAWRIVELRNAQAPTERAKIEKRLAQIVLRDQRLIWRQLSTSSYCVYGISWRATSPPGDPRWIVPWGENRELWFEYPFFHWRRVLAAFLLTVLGILLVVLARSLLRKVRG